MPKNNHVYFEVSSVRLPSTCSRYCWAWALSFDGSTQDRTWNFQMPNNKNLLNIMVWRVDGQCCWPKPVPSWAITFLRISECISSETLCLQRFWTCLVSVVASHLPHKWPWVLAIHGGRLNHACQPIPVKSHFFYCGRLCQIHFNYKGCRK